MPRLGWFALGGGVGVLLGLWIARASDAVHLAPMGSEEPEVGGVVHAGAAAPAVHASVAGPAARTAATPGASASASAIALQARIEELATAGAPDRDVEALLVERVGLGDDGGVDYALEWMERRELGSNAMFWSRLFEGVDDPRIGAVAQRVLKANRAQRRSSWVHTKGYVDLMATHGGGPEAESIVGFLDDRDLAYFASTAIAHLDGKVDGERVLGTLTEELDEALVDNVANGLALWRRPRTSAGLWSLAIAPATRASTRVSLFRSLARTASGADAVAFTQRYFELHESAERVAFLTALDVLDCELEAGRCLAAWNAVLESALQDADPDVRAEALRRLRSRPSLHTSEMLARLRTLAQASDDSDELELVEDVIRSVERSLG